MPGLPALCLWRPGVTLASVSRLAEPRWEASDVPGPMIAAT